ncbi:MAG: DUF3631 domain-containing protein [Pseudomonadota bacterium]
MNPLPAEPRIPALILQALGRLEQDPGALFEDKVLELLRQLRHADPPCWARCRQWIKASGRVSLAELDKLTAAAPPAPDSGAPFAAVIPWPVPVDGAALLQAVTVLIRRHVVAEPATINAAALWVVFTWFIDVVDVAPIANVTAPEKRCGKTILLGVMARLVCRPLAVSNIATAALFRALQLWAPSLLIDEVDAFLSAHEDARGILNAGFTRDAAYVIRCVGEEHTPTCFNVWGAKALCGIGKIADTLADRSIVLRLRRKLPGERTVKLRHADPQAFAEVAAQLARFALDNREPIRGARPAEIEGLSDRANDCWEPLLAIAELAGGAWPRLARVAAVALHGLEEDAPSIGAELLADIKAVFETKRSSRLFSVDLLAALAADEESPWATWNRGKPMTVRQLAAKLGGYGIRSKQLRIGCESGRKGYEQRDFMDAWRCYLGASPGPASTALQPSQHGACGDLPGSTESSAVEAERPRPASGHGPCRAVEVAAVEAGEARDDPTAEYF